MGHPTIYPTGVTILEADRVFEGYTLFQAPGLGAVLIDLNGGQALEDAPPHAEGYGDWLHINSVSVAGTQTVLDSGALCVAPEKPFLSAGH